MTEIVIPNTQGVNEIAYNQTSINKTRAYFKFHVESLDTFEAGVPGIGSGQPEEEFFPCVICVPPSCNVICIPPRPQCLQT